MRETEIDTERDRQTYRQIDGKRASSKFQTKKKIRTKGNSMHQISQRGNFTHP